MIFIYITYHAKKKNIVNNRITVVLEKSLFEDGRHAWSILTNDNKEPPRTIHQYGYYENHYNARFLFKNAEDATRAYNKINSLKDIEELSKEQYGEDDEIG